MKYKAKLKIKKEYLIAPITIRKILEKENINIGRYCASARVSGWGNFYGKVEVTEHELKFELISRTEFIVNYLKVVCVKIDFPNEDITEKKKVLKALKDFEIEDRETYLIVKKKKERYI